MSETQQSTARTTRSGRIYGSQAGPSASTTPGELADLNNAMTVVMMLNPTVKYYSRKCKLSAVLDDGINKEVFQNHLLLISTNYSCIRFDAMNFMHYLSIYQASRNIFLFNPADVNHIKLCYRLVLPNYQIRPDDLVRLNEPMTYLHIIKARRFFNQLKTNQNYQEVNTRNNDNEVDLIYQHLVYSFAVQYQTSVKNHLVNVGLRLFKTFEAIIVYIRRQTNPANPRRTPKQIAGSCVDFIMDAAHPSTDDLEFYAGVSDEIAQELCHFHNYYVHSFANVNRDRSYVEDVNNIGVTAMPLLKVHMEILDCIENFETSLADEDENNDGVLRMKRWSLLPLPANTMINFRLSGEYMMYHFLLQSYKKLPMVGRQELPFAITAMLDDDRLPKFTVFQNAYKNQKRAIWDSVFKIREKFGRNSREQFLNSITTDGCGISFLFEKPSPTSNIIPITFQELKF
ncbi:unnamed protein product [Mucor hiemalis]